MFTANDHDGLARKDRPSILEMPHAVFERPGQQLGKFIQERPIAEIRKAHPVNPVPERLL